MLDVARSRIWDAWCPLRSQRLDLPVVGGPLFRVRTTRQRPPRNRTHVQANVAQRCGVGSRRRSAFADGTGHIGPVRNLDHGRGYPVDVSGVVGSAGAELPAGRMPGQLGDQLGGLTLCRVPLELGGRSQRQHLLGAPLSSDLVGRGAERWVGEHQVHLADLGEHVQAVPVVDGDVIVGVVRLVHNVSRW